MGRRRNGIVRSLGVLLLAVLVVAAAACSDDSAPGEAGASPASSDAENAASDPSSQTGSTEDPVETGETGPIETDVNELLETEPGEPLPLEAGDYELAALSPPLTFALSDVGILNGVLPVEADLTLGPNLNVRLLFLNDSFAPLRPGAKQTSGAVKLDEVAETPEALAGWLRQHPRLSASKPRPVTIAGAEGSELEIEVKEGEGYRSDLCPGAQPCVVLFHTEPDAEATFVHALEEGERARVAVFEADGRRMIAMTQTDGNLDRLAKFADEVLSTVSFGD
jgi:hypothetical protein